MDKCCWDIGTPCEGEVKGRKIFGEDLDKMPLCDSHMQFHEKIMLLYHQGFMVEEIMDMDVEKIIREYNILKFMGIDFEGVKI